MHLAQRSAQGKAIAQRRAPLLVRSDWVQQQIRQRQHKKTVQQLLKANQARWNAINPEWAAYGPELPLVSRGGGRASLGAVDPAVFVAGGALLNGLVTFGLMYAACRLAMKKK